MKKIFALGLSRTFRRRRPRDFVYVHAKSLRYLSDLDHTHSYAWGMSNATLKAQLKTGGYKITGCHHQDHRSFILDKNRHEQYAFINLIDNPVLGLSTRRSMMPPIRASTQGIVSNYFGGNIAGE